MILERFAVVPRLAYELVGASLWAAADEPAGDTGIPWPVSLGIAGVAIAAMLSMLVWLIKRQASGAWVTKQQHDDDLARSDTQHARELAVVAADRDAWREAHGALATTHEATTQALSDSIAANKANDRAWDLLTQRLGVAPQQGDNGRKSGGDQ